MTLGLARRESHPGSLLADAANGVLVDSGRLAAAVLWATLGYGLQEAWPYPLAVAIGDGVTATVPLLWVVMICAAFARPNGLFVAHFGWPRNRVAKAMRYYLMSIGLIVPLIMAVIMFDNLNDREFPARWAAFASS